MTREQTNTHAVPRSPLGTTPELLRLYGHYASPELSLRVQRALQGHARDAALLAGRVRQAALAAAVGNVPDADAANVFR
jgi:hypothetical protein